LAGILNLDVLVCELIVLTYKAVCVVTETPQDGDGFSSAVRAMKFHDEPRRKT
jgi:hypothetical protein